MSIVLQPPASLYENPQVPGANQGIRQHTEDTFLITDSGLEHWTKDCPRDLVLPI